MIINIYNLSCEMHDKLLESCGTEAVINLDFHRNEKLFPVFRAVISRGEFSQLIVHIIQREAKLNY